MINIEDSLSFLSICRDTLDEMYTEKDFKYFIQYEASDYQIMNIIVNNEIPVEKYNTIEEHKLWESFQQIIYENTNSKYIHKLFAEMGPIFEYNLSSSKSVLNILEVEQPKFVASLFNKLSIIRKNSKSALQKSAKATVDYAKKGSLNTIAVGMAGGAAAGIIAFAANKIYQNFLSKAARDCKGKPDKVACMKNHKNKALRMRIDKLKSGIGQCNKAKNSENCVKSLQSKISRLQTIESNM